MKNTCFTFRVNLADFVLPHDVPESSITGAQVVGSFTLWQQDAQFTMHKADDARGACFVLEKAYDELQIPGNSGLPEYTIVLSYADKTGAPAFYTLTAKDARESEPEASFLGNFVVAFDAEMLLQLQKTKQGMELVKPLARFNLMRAEDCATLANVRRVPGTTCLWRGYHPYKKSRPNLDSEDTRIRLVNRFLKAQHIRTIITLSGKESIDRSCGECLLPPVRKIIRAHRQHLIDTSYETMYFNPESEEYAAVVKSLVRFINRNNGPYYLHCRLGSDRTGTTSSILAALCGASWKDIAADYERTSQAGFGEYRSQKLLAYAYTKMLKKPPEEVANLSEELAAYFVRKKILNEHDIQRLRKKLR